MVNHIYTLEYPPNFAITISRMWFNSPHLKGRNCDAAKLWLLVKISEHLHLICGEICAETRDLHLLCKRSINRGEPWPLLRMESVSCLCKNVRTYFTHTLERIWRFPLHFPPVGFQQHAFTRYRAMSLCFDVLAILAWACHCLLRI